MSLLSIPFLNNKKTAISGWFQVIAGLLYAAADILKVLSECMSGALPLEGCVDALWPAFIALSVAANGLGTLGIGHKIEKK